MDGETWRKDLQQMEKLLQEFQGAVCEFPAKLVTGKTPSNAYIPFKIKDNCQGPPFGWNAERKCQKSPRDSNTPASQSSEPSTLCA